MDDVMLIIAIASAALKVNKYAMLAVKNRNNGTFPDQLRMMQEAIAELQVAIKNLGG